ncbi:MAG: hypothetical protein EP341_02960 [Sphingomonadales bacterium]|nr:MAG: hypothetical protein EP341_02960 [Sphingomonadales bacterium]
MMHGSPEETQRRLEERAAENERLREALELIVDEDSMIEVDTVRRTETVIYGEFANIALDALEQETGRE